MVSILNPELTFPKYIWTGTGIYLWEWSIYLNPISRSESLISSNTWHWPYHFHTSLFPFIFIWVLFCLAKSLGLILSFHFFYVHCFPDGFLIRGTLQGVSKLTLVVCKIWSSPFWSCLLSPFLHSQDPKTPGPCITPPSPVKQDEAEREPLIREKDMKWSNTGEDVGDKRHNMGVGKLEDSKDIPGERLPAYPWDRPVEWPVTGSFRSIVFN